MVVPVSTHTRIGRAGLASTGDRQAGEPVDQSRAVLMRSHHVAERDGDGVMASWPGRPLAAQYCQSQIESTWNGTPVQDRKTAICVVTHAELGGLVC